MRLSIVRHGKAHRDSPTGADCDRELMNRGRRQAEWLAEHLAQLDDSPVLLVSSPVVRARQTAEIVAAALHVEVRLDDRLDTETSVTRVIEVVTEHADVEALAIFGHNPTFSALASHIAGESIGLKTGQCLAIDVDADNPVGSGRNPDLLRAPTEVPWGVRKAGDQRLEL